MSIRINYNDNSIATFCGIEDVNTAIRVLAKIENTITPLVRINWIDEVTKIKGTKYSVYTRLYTLNA